MNKLIPPAVTECAMLQGALYRYVLRRLEETRTALEIMKRIYSDPHPNYDHMIYVSTDEVVKECRLFWGLLPTPSWLAGLASQWEQHKKKGRM